MFLKSVLLSVAVMTTLAGCVNQMEVANRDAKYKQLNTPLKTQISVPFNEEQAKARIYKGHDAVDAAMEMISILDQLEIED